jgi:GNAT superfamily N-acetyltransferase
LTDLAPDWQKKLPRYPAVPSVRLGRLAIDRGYQGRKLGAALSANTVARALRSEIAAHMMIVEAKDEAASAFWLHRGVRPDPLELCDFASWPASPWPSASPDDGVRTDHCPHAFRQV